ncbi:MAG TPA: BON domain-containing protein [Gemmatimonadales bacterium]|nr:BON domain-containing protein [Gemmatimonadales bacterium]
MRNDRSDRLTAGQFLLWGALGAAAGLVAGVALSEWLGDVNRHRLRRAATRLQTPRARQLSAAAGARAAGAAIESNSMLRELGLEPLAVAKGVVELRGWVPNRAARALAARVVGALPGIDHVINSILVRGEDDRPLAAEPQPAHDQTA